MLNNQVALLALFAVAQAALTDDVASVSSQASVLSSLVNGFDGSGLTGALAIQNSYGPFSSAVKALEEASNSATADDVSTSNVAALNDMVSALTGLLDALASKASAFTGVGASQIVQGDVNGLTAPSEGIVSNLVKVGQANCEAISSLSGPVASLSSAFNAAAGSYSASTVSFVEVSCSGGAAAGSGAASSAAATSGSSGAGGVVGGAGSGNSSSGGAAGAGSGNSSSGGAVGGAGSGNSSSGGAGGASHPSGSSGASGSGSSSGSHSNLAAPVTAGLGALLAGAAALLL